MRRPCATPRPSVMSMPRARHRSVNSRQRRLLPVPGSATTPTTWPPSRERSYAASSASSSASRPTKRDKPRTADTSSRVRALPTPLSAYACTGSWTPLTWSSPTSSDRKSTRLNSSHVAISYAVFCLKKKKKKKNKEDYTKKKKKQKQKQKPTKIK